MLSEHLTVHTYRQKVKMQALMLLLKRDHRDASTAAWATATAIQSYGCNRSLSLALAFASTVRGGLRLT